MLLLPKSVSQQSIDSIYISLSGLPRISHHQPPVSPFHIGSLGPDFTLLLTPLTQESHEIVLHSNLMHDIISYSSWPERIGINDTVLKQSYPHEKHRWGEVDIIFENRETGIQVPNNYMLVKRRWEWLALFWKITYTKVFNIFITIFNSYNTF